MSDEPALTFGDLLPSNITDWSKALRSVSTEGPRIPTWPIVGAQADAEVRRALAGFDLGQALASVWVGYKALASHHGDGPGQGAILDLGHHEISIGATPTLTLTYGDITFPPVRVTYAATLAFDSVKLAVTEGYLTTVQPGDCRVTGGLSCGKVPLHPPLESKPVRLPLIWTLDPKLRLPPPLG